MALELGSNTVLAGTLLKVGDSFSFYPVMSVFNGSFYLSISSILLEGR